MDNQRLLVWAAFGMLAFMTYQAWLQDYAPQSPTEVTAAEGETPPGAVNDVDVLNRPSRVRFKIVGEHDINTDR